MKQTKHYDVIIIGAGFSGCVAATHLNPKLKVLLLDSNKIILKKFLITGNGNANITNTLPIPNFLNNLIDNNKFMYSSLNSYGSEKLLDWCTQLGIRSFEKTIHRIHLVDSNDKFKLAVEEKLKSQVNLKLQLETTVDKVFLEANKFYVECGIEEYSGDALVIATGGISYPKTGCTGMGYKIAKAFQHCINPTYAIGVGVNISDKKLLALQGLSIENVKVGVMDEKQHCLYEETGDLMVTHFGLGGPVIRRVSGYVSQQLLNHRKVSLNLEVYTPKEVETTLRQNNYLSQCFKPLNSRLVYYLYDKLGIENDLTTANLNKVEKQKIIDMFSRLNFPIESVRDIEEAINTGGGVITKELDPKTMESKITSNLYFIGEVIDVNPRTNGFNLTVSFATACACANAINAKH